MDIFVGAVLVVQFLDAVAGQDQELGQVIAVDGPPRQQIQQRPHGVYTTPPRSSIQKSGKPPIGSRAASRRRFCASHSTQA